MNEGTQRSSRQKAPGGNHSDTDELDASGSFLGYTVGLAFALILTGASFLVAHSHVLWAPGLPVGLAVLVWWAAPFGLDLVGLDDFALIGRILATIAALSVLEAALARLR